MVLKCTQLQIQKAVLDHPPKQELFLNTSSFPGCVCVSETREEHIPLATEQDLFNFSPHSIGQKKPLSLVNTARFSHPNQLTGGPSSPQSNVSFDFVRQVRGRSRVPARGGRRVRWGCRSLRHQPFLLPPGAIWNRHLGMRNWPTWTPTTPRGRNALKWSCAMAIFFFF